jgi:hypothetical protein
VSGHAGNGHYILEIVGDFEGMSWTIYFWKRIPIYVLVGA